MSTIASVLEKKGGTGQVAQAKMLGKSVRNNTVQPDEATVTKLIESLSDIEHLMLRMSSYGYPDDRIDAELRKLSGWQSSNSCEFIRNGMYSKLGVSEIEKERDRFTAAGKLYFRYVDSTAARDRVLIEPDYTTMSVPQAAPQAKAPIRPSLPSPPSQEKLIADRAELDRIWTAMQTSGALESDEDVNELMRG